MGLLFTMLNPPDPITKCREHSYKWATVSVAGIVVGGSKSNSLESKKRARM